MKLAVLLGVLLGAAALVLAWTRAVPRPPAAAPAAETVATTAAGGGSRSPGPALANEVEGPAAPTAAAPAGGLAGDLVVLRARSLLVPVAGYDLRRLRDDFGDPRTGHAHEALDLLAPRGTPVLAVDDGFVAKLFTSARGGLTVYHFDPTQSYCYYYAHLDRYAEGLREGLTLRKGALIGYVGTTGNAPPQTPHLHFAIFRLGPDRRWWQGTAIDPFPLWALPAPAAAAAGGAGR